MHWVTSRVSLQALQPLSPGHMARAAHQAPLCMAYSAKYTLASGTVYGHSASVSRRRSRHPPTAVLRTAAPTTTPTMTVS